MAPTKWIRRSIAAGLMLVMVLWTGAGTHARDVSAPPVGGAVSVGSAREGPVARRSLDADQGGVLLPVTLRSAGPPWTEMPSADPLETFFSHDQIHEVSIAIDEHGIASLLERPKTYVHGEVTIDGASYSDVGVRLKGGAGSFVPLDGDYPEVSGDGNGRPGKSAFIVDFNRYERGVDHLGLEKLTLNNLVQDPSGIHEYLGYAVFREGGVPASRTGFASVYLNGEEKGLYALLETPDNEEFLEHWFGTDKGNLYEGEYGVDLSADMVGGFDQDNGKDESRRDLRQLVDALDRAEAEIERGVDPFPVLSEHIDMDRYLAYSATELFLGHWDGYAWSTNNYMIHHGPAGARWTFLPWGVDQLFEDPLGEFGGVMRHPGPSWRPGPGGRVHDLCFESEACQRELLEAYARLLDRVQEMGLLGLAADAGALVREPLLAEAHEFGDPDLTHHALEQVPRYILEHSATIDRWLPCLAHLPVDGDRDGFDGCTLDCNDHDPRIHPGAAEACNFRDDDCNGRIDDPDECPKCFDIDAPDGHTYSMCFEREPWPAAHRSCTDRGQNLASFHDDATFEQVTFTFMERVGVHRSWIGLNDRDEEGTFVWADATEVDFERWAPYAPRRYGDDFDCALSREFGWIDEACAESHAYVCSSR